MRDAGDTRRRRAASRTAGCNAYRCDGVGRERYAWHGILVLLVARPHLASARGVEKGNGALPVLRELDEKAAVLAHLQEGARGRGRGGRGGGSNGTEERQKRRQQWDRGEAAEEEEAEKAAMGQRRRQRRGRGTVGRGVRQGRCAIGDRRQLHREVAPALTVAATSYGRAVSIPPCGPAFLP